MRYALLCGRSYLGQSRSNWVRQEWEGICIAVTLCTYRYHKRGRDENSAQERSSERKERLLRVGALPRIRPISLLSCYTSHQLPATSQQAAYCRQKAML